MIHYLFTRLFLHILPTFKEWKKLWIKTDMFC